MGITTFGLSTPYFPKLGIVNLTSSDLIGSLEAVEVGDDAPEDWRFETGVIGIVLRVDDDRKVIHVARTEEALNDLTAATARTFSTGEWGVTGIGTPIRRNAANGEINLYNLFFAVTDRDSTNKQSETVAIELYINIA